MSINIVKEDIKSFIKAGRLVQGAQSQKIHFVDDDIKRFLSLKNPLFKKGRGQRTYFTAMKDGKPAGRILAHIHHASNNKFKETRGCFGFFESIDDAHVAKALFTAAEEYLKKEGCTWVAGNFNLTAMQKMGVMTSGFENPPFTDQMYSQNYYPALLEASGYTRFFPMTTFSLKVKDWNLSDYQSPRTQELKKSPDVELVPILKSQLNESLDIARRILNDGFEENPFFVAVSAEEFSYQAKDMARIIDTRITKLVNFKGKPAGVLIAIPDIDSLLSETDSKINLKFLWKFLTFRKTNRRASIIFYSVAREFHNQGLNSFLLSHFVESVKEAGYTDVGLTWIADVNKPSLRQAEKLKGIPYHQLHLFKKEI